MRYISTLLLLLGPTTILGAITAADIKPTTWKSTDTEKVEINGWFAGLEAPSTTPVGKNQLYEMGRAMLSLLLKDLDYQAALKQDKALEMIIIAQGNMVILTVINSSKKAPGKATIEPIHPAIVDDVTVCIAENGGSPTPCGGTMSVNV